MALRRQFTCDQTWRMAFIACMVVCCGACYHNEPKVVTVEEMRSRFSDEQIHEMVQSYDQLNLVIERWTDFHISPEARERFRSKTHRRGLLILTDDLELDRNDVAHRVVMSSIFAEVEVAVVKGPACIPLLTRGTEAECNRFVSQLESLLDAAARDGTDYVMLVYREKGYDSSGFSFPAVQGVMWGELNSSPLELTIAAASVRISEIDRFEATMQSLHKALVKVD